MKFYTLNDKKEVVEVDIDINGIPLTSVGNRIVKKSYFADFELSTVFLHYPPGILKQEFFETMIFSKDELNTYCERTDTYENAEKQHYLIIGKIILHKLKLLDLLN